MRRHNGRKAGIKKVGSLSQFDDDLISIVDLLITRRSESNQSPSINLSRDYDSHPHLSPPRSIDMARNRSFFPTAPERSVVEGGERGRD